MAPRPFHGKVVGVGLGRTGTNSLSVALNHLGIRTRHFPGPLTREDLRSGRKHLAVLRDYQGIANGTGAPYRLIDREYPDAKFVLTIRRDREAWIESKRRYAALELENWSRFDTATRASKRLIREEVYGSFEFDADAWLAAYTGHTRAVLEYFAGRPAGLLEMDIGAGDGWDVLCPFLGVPAPTIPFPHENSLEAASEWYGKVARVWADIDRWIAPDQTFVMVDDDELGVRERRAIPFLERNGEYWGRPTDDGMAVAELERMRRAGAGFVVFVWSTFWWLEHYRGFHQYLLDRYEPVLQNDRVLVFDLRPDGEA
jgi:hypothetical protein